jgi:hypothetical protein
MDPSELTDALKQRQQGCIALLENARIRDVRDLSRAAATADWFFCDEIIVTSSFCSSIGWKLFFLPPNHLSH